MPIAFLFSILWMCLDFTGNFMSLKLNLFADYLSAFVILARWPPGFKVSDQKPFKVFIIVSISNIDQAFSWVV